MTLPLVKASYQFNPQTLQPLGVVGTVYPTLKLAADWGVLEVDGGALLDHDPERRRGVGDRARSVRPEGRRMAARR